MLSLSFLPPKPCTGLFDHIRQQDVTHHAIHAEEAITQLLFTKTNVTHANYMAFCATFPHKVPAEANAVFSYFQLPKFGLQFQLKVARNSIGLHNKILQNPHLQNFN